MPATYLYHAFLSHSVDDKIGIAHELDAALKAKGLEIWYSSRDLTVGDSIIDRINDGLAQCRFGIIIISPTFLDKFWGPYELSVLLSKGEEKKVLPVLYNMTKDELAIKAPMIAGIFTIEASQGIPYVAEKIYTEIKKEKISIRKPPLKGNPSKTRYLLWAAVVLMGVLGIIWWARNVNKVPPQSIINDTIEQRIQTVQQLAEKEQNQFVLTTEAKSVNGEVVKKLFTDFKNVSSYYRNEYILNTGRESIHSRKGVEKELAINLEDVTPFSQYGFVDPFIYRGVSSTNGGYREEKYLFSSSQPVSYSISSSTNADNTYKIRVSYTNSIRLIQTTLLFPSVSRDTKRHQVSIVALRPSEVFAFAFKNGEWKLTLVE